MRRLLELERTESRDIETYTRICEEVKSLSFSQVLQMEHADLRRLIESANNAGLLALSPGRSADLEKMSHEQLREKFLWAQKLACCC